jgi:hypothetical protein
VLQRAESLIYTATLCVLLLGVRHHCGIISRKDAETQRRKGFKKGIFSQILRKGAKAQRREGREGVLIYEMLLFIYITISAHGFC